MASCTGLVCEDGYRLRSRTRRAFAVSAVTECYQFAALSKLEGFGMAENAGASQGAPAAATGDNQAADDMLRASEEIIEALTAARNYVAASSLNLQAASPDLMRQRDAMGRAMAQIDRCTAAAHLIRDLAQRAARGDRSRANSRSRE